MVAADTDSPNKTDACTCTLPAVIDHTDTADSATPANSATTVLKLALKLASSAADMSNVVKLTVKTTFVPTGIA